MDRALRIRKYASQEQRDAHIRQIGKTLCAYFNKNEGQNGTTPARTLDFPERSRNMKDPDELLVALKLNEDRKEKKQKDTAPIPNETNTSNSTNMGSDGASSSQQADANLASNDRPRLPSPQIKALMSRWRDAARRARASYVDPWSCFNISDCPVVRAKRYRYSSIRKAWTEDFVEVRIHPEPFAKGAMRECFRLKKLSSVGGHANDWSHAHNYVAKRYMNDVDRRVLFDDVKLQMDAKLWAEEFNRYNPPKKIDIMQMCVIEVIDLPNSPLYHLEHFIEGEYLKYNSNSGFVSDVARQTPQAFSHFTFERSGHQMIVVDIQGVGDLYTDPQVHTVIGSDYGDGNLGTRGMALFFHSHECNDICHSLCLSQFDLSPAEQLEIAKKSSTRRHVNASTVFSRDRQSSVCYAIPNDNSSSADAMEYLRRRTISMDPATRSSFDSHDDNCFCQQCIAQTTDALELESSSDDDSDDCNDDYEESELITGERARPRKVAFHDLRVLRPDSRHDSIGSSVGTESLNSSRITKDTERDDYWKLARKQSIPAGALSAIELCELREFEARVNQTSALGQIHVDIARYHELGRFLDVDNGEKLMLGNNVEDGHSTAVSYDKKSALFHIDVARKCGSLEAITTLAHISYDMPHELLKDISADDIYGPNDNADDKENIGFELMEMAAEMGDRNAMIFVANAYETGRGLGNDHKTNYKRAVEWYERLAGFQDVDEKDSFSAPHSRYEVLAKMAEMYKDGGYELDQDYERAAELFTEAAEAAMEAMHGKLATKYYEKAEMCSM